MSVWLPLKERQLLFAMVDVFETLPASELRALASGASLEHLGAGETMMAGPQEHARRVIVLLSGRAQVYEPGPEGHTLTVSVAEAGTVVGWRAFPSARGFACGDRDPLPVVPGGVGDLRGGGPAQPRGGLAPFARPWREDRRPGNEAGRPSLQEGASAPGGRHSAAGGG